MVKFDLNHNKVLGISAVLTFFLTASLFVYYNYKLEEQTLEFNSQLELLNEKLGQNFNLLENNLDSLKGNLTTEIQVLDTNLKSFKSQNQEEIDTLTELIDEIESQSEIQLGELKDELQSIRVKSKDFTAIIDDVIQSVVSISTNKGLGSGAVIDNKGFIVTNYHVIDGASIIRILTYDDDVYDASLIGFNDVVDVAVLKVDASLPNLRFADSDVIKVGEKVIALGNPAGLSFTVTEGIVSAVHRKGPNGLGIYLQTDVSINPGNSGGPLVNANSRIIGLNNFKIRGFEGLGFAIESNTVKEVAKDIIDQYLAQQ
jgi:S1-C subfamily serine protease